MARDKVERLVESADLVGEGPVWYSGLLYWVDIVGKVVKSLDPETGAMDSWPTPEFVSAVIPRRDGGFLLPMVSGIFQQSTADGTPTLCCSPDAARPGNRFNDAGVDPRGRLWAGSMQNNINDDATPREMDRWSGALFRIDPDRTVTEFETGLGIANTFAWSPDETRFYFAETLDGSIHVYDFDADSGEIAAKRLFARTEGRGAPDGSCVDVDGCLWNARFGGGVVIRYRPDGEIDRILEMPVPNVTSCTFIGPRLDRLAITTARFGMSATELDRYPDAGHLFVADVGTQGLATVPFAG
ncbi:SMP-30/gluconolactonase/LRE family protein [Fodinicurvata sp. EGI_FJ10296]|uniref:SMP-30/gluconolactonase/LRE family protein n=1 Tax=Fodinicurvata sp. EGI_FJ10296 TaxID=3231908 RepID=UPI003451B4A2